MIDCNINAFLFILVRLPPSISMLIVGGMLVGSGHESKLVTSDIVSEDPNSKPLPNLPTRFEGYMLFMQNGNMFVCGGSGMRVKECLILKNGIWKKQSYMNEERYQASIATNMTATFMFGGFTSDQNTYEYLPYNSTKWKLGKTNIPGGFSFGNAITISEEYIWLIGGIDTPRRILAFNTKTHTFKELDSKLLNHGRYGHRCALIPGTKKIIVTGGQYNGYNPIILQAFEGNFTGR